MNHPKNFDPIAEFHKHWHTGKPGRTPMLENMRQLSHAQARRAKALQDLDEAMRDIVQLEAEREFLKATTFKN